MKKNLKFLLPTFLSVFVLVSCEFWHGFGSSNKQTNNLFECFLSTDVVDEFVYYLRVEQINEKSFNLAEGLNVVSDFLFEDTTPKYYLIDMYSLINENRQHYNFKNLKIVDPSNKNQRICYADENNNYLTPSPSKNNKSSSYTVTYNNINLTFFKDVN